ncbi:MAG: thiamine phosphate synthase [Chitinivibrionales bacterium]|nr:thiamine phosphate synthase [Chitinivibrionales bacterium]
MDKKTGLELKLKDGFGFYAILTDPLRGYEYCASLCVELSVPLIQLRMKDVSRYAVLRMAEKLRKITENSASKFIVNDFADVAVDCAADGVHIGQDDGKYGDIRAQVGESMIIGISTHNPKQTEQACTSPKPDYIGIGPVYPTPTKKHPDPVVGLSGMKAMLEKATVPAVCIGGITLQTLPLVLTNGAKNFCLVRPVCASEAPGEVIRKIQELYCRHQEKVAR